MSLQGQSKSPVEACPLQGPVMQTHEGQLMLTGRAISRIYKISVARFSGLSNGPSLHGAQLRNG